MGRNNAERRRPRSYAGRTRAELSAGWLRAIEAHDRMTAAAWEAQRAADRARQALQAIENIVCVEDVFYAIPHGDPIRKPDPKRIGDLFAELYSLRARVRRLEGTE